MSADPDITRVVRSWLRTDEHESADRVLEHVLALLDTTPQRRSWWPARRIADMNAYAKLLVAAAAVVVVVVVGINLMPASAGVGGGGAVPTASPTPAPTPSPTPVPTPAATPVANDYPRETDLKVGTRYPWIVNGVPLSLAVPAPGWTTIGAVPSTMNRGAAAADGPLTGSWFILWDVDNVNAVPCTTTALATAPGSSAADLAAAVAAIPKVTVVTGPSDVTVGGRPAKHLVLRLPDTLGCAPDKFNLWFESNAPGCGGDTGPCWRYASEAGQTIAIWIVDAPAGRVFIEAETYKGTSPEVSDEIQQIVDSVQFD